MALPNSPVDFLYKAWSEVCEPGDHVFLCTRKKGEDKKKGWDDYSFPFGKDMKPRLRDWLRQNNPKEMDVYWCPLPFDSPQRKAKYVRPVNLLWSDIDDGDPTKCRPSVLWESSPGRHHGLWFLDEKLHAEDAAALNKSVTYLLGADKGGWDLSQVLRIPGTFNHKYDSKPEVKLLHWEEKLLSHKIIAKKAKHAIPEAVDTSERDWGDADAILKNYRLPTKLLTLLHGEAEQGKRSEMLWYLENKLSEAGMSPEEVITVIRESDWNKFKGRKDGDEQLRVEMMKIIEKQITAEPPRRNKAQTQPGDFRLQTFHEVMSSLQTTPGWLIPGFWMKQSHGIVAGEPKSMKTTLFMDAMISIATGSPFLGKYPVEETGNVLYVQNENAEWIMKDRFEKMLMNKGLIGKVSNIKGSNLRIKFQPDVPLYMVNQQGFTLTDPDQQDWLEETIQELKPIHIVLDPLYLMFDGDIASAQELFPILQWLLYLKNEYKCGITLIHHWNKGGESKRGGQRMLGSTTLHGWIESAWYLKSMPADGDEAEIVMEREFRGAGLHNKLGIRVKMGDMGDPTYEVSVEDHFAEEEDTKPVRGGGPKKGSPEQMMDDIISVITSRKGASETIISQNTGYNTKQVRETLDVMISKNTCYREAGKVYLRTN
ncbi:DNA recombinase [Pseudomonas phage Almagne]|nr:DNA recombinase [Pseudomonas phage Almagne]